MEGMNCHGSAYLLRDTARQHRTPVDTMSSNFDFRMVVIAAERCRDTDAQVILGHRQGQYIRENEQQQRLKAVHFAYTVDWNCYCSACATVISYRTLLLTTAQSERSFKHSI